MIPRAPVVACLVLLVALAAASAPSDGSSHYDVALSPSIDVPDRGVIFKGEEYPVTELGRVHRGEPIHVSVAVGESTRAELQLLDEDHNVVGGDEGTGDGEVSFPTENRQPGTYVVALRVDDAVVDLEPVVVSAYDVSVDAPDEAQAGSTIDVTADLATVEPADAPYRVRVVFGSGREQFRTTLTKESETTYAGSVDTSGLSPGTYTLYVVAEEIEEVFKGEKAVLGASDPRTIEITASTAEETDGGGDGAGGGSGGGGDGSGGGGGGGDGAGGGSAGGGTAGDGAATEPAGATTVAGTDPATDGTVGATTEPAAGSPAATVGPATDRTAERTETTGAATTSTPGQALGGWSAVVALLAVALLALGRRRFDG